MGQQTHGQLELAQGDAPASAAAGGPPQRRSDCLLADTFPGSVVLRSLTDEDRDRLEARRRPLPAPLPMRTHDRSLVNAYVDLLLPWFEGYRGLDFTGTYSDAYGYRNGLMLSRNVEADFRRFMSWKGLHHRPWAIGIERHPQTHRNVLHLHAIVAGDWTREDCDDFRACWAVHRGHAKAKPVVDADGFCGYVCKHLLKQGSDGDQLAFYLPPPRFRSRHDRRQWELENADRYARIAELRS